MISISLLARHEENVIILTFLTDVVYRIINKNHEALGKYQGKLINITLPAEILALGIDESQGKVTRMDLPFEE